MRLKSSTVCVELNPLLIYGQTSTEYTHTQSFADAAVLANFTAIDFDYRSSYCILKDTQSRIQYTECVVKTKCFNFCYKSIHTNWSTEKVVLFDHSISVLVVILSLLSHKKRGSA